MIIKKIKAEDRRRGAETAAYIADATGAEDGETFGPKTAGAAHGAINCLSDSWREAAEEISLAERAYDGEGQAVAHWVLSWGEGERPTPEQEREAWEIFLKSQGMQDHMLIFSGHTDKPNYHSHALVCRLKPDPDPDGSCRIQHEGGAVTRAGPDGKHRNNEIYSAHMAIAEICKKQGWNTDANMYNENGKLKTQDPDKIRLGQRIEAAEARSGEPDPRRVMAEKAVEVFRQSKSWEEAREKLAKNDIFLRFTDRIDSKDRAIFGGYIKDGEGKSVKLSALPKDCSYKALDARFNGQEVTKPTAPTLKPLTANAAKGIARKIFKESSSFEEAEKKLAEKGLKLERYGKTGGYLRFGDGEQEKVKLSALGGKYSINALSKKFNEGCIDSSTAYASKMHETQANVKSQKNQQITSQRLENAQENAAEAAQETGNARTLSEALDDAFSQARAQDALRQAQSAAHAAAARADAAEARLKELQQKQEDNNMMNGHHPTPAAKPQAVQEEKTPETSLTNDSSDANTQTPAQTTPAPVSGVETAQEAQEAQKPRKRPGLSFGGKPTAPGKKSGMTHSGPRM